MGVQMPNNMLKSIADKNGISMDKAEKLWNQAKAIVTKEYGKREKDGDAYWKLVVGVVKKMAGVKKESVLDMSLSEICQLSESTVTGDVEKSPKPMKQIPKEDEREIGDPTPMIIRQPDLVGPYGEPAFSIENPKIGPLLKGKQPHQRWNDIIDDEGITNWAKQNSMKSFYVANNGLFFKVR